MKGDCCVAIFANSFVCFLALLIASGTIFYTIPKTAAKLDSSLYKLNDFVIIGTFLMWLWCWMYATFADPGRVVDDLKRRGYYDQIKKGDIPQFIEHLPICPKCHVPTPPGTVHCSDCGQCILRQDHHCGVIGQCVGDKNFKAFIQSFFYGSVVSLETGLYSLRYILMSNSHRDIDVIGLILCVYGFVLCIMMLSFGYSFFSMGRANGAPKNEKVPYSQYIASFGSKLIDFLIPIQKTSTKLAWPGVEWEFEEPLALL